MFVEKWNWMMDQLASAGKFKILGKEFDLFSGAESLKISVEQPPSVPSIEDPSPEPQV